MTQHTVYIYDDEAIEFDKYDSHDDLPKPDGDKTFEGLLDAMMFVSKWLPEADVAEVEHRSVGANTIGFYAVGQSWDCLLIRGDTIKKKRTLSDTPDFGESNLDGPQASTSVWVRQPLNDYSELEEVFEFTVQEPSNDQAARRGIPGVRYYITRDSRTGRPGVDDPEISRSMMHLNLVPDDIVERAQQMLGHVSWEEDDE